MGHEEMRQRVKTLAVMRGRDRAVTGKKTVLLGYTYFTTKTTALGLNGGRESPVEWQSLKGRVNKRSSIVYSS